MDATLTGRSYRAYGESFPVFDSENVDDTAIMFQSRANVSDGVSSIIPHFAPFGTEIHAGLIHPRGESKTEILFCLKPLFMYDDPGTLDDADFSDVIVDEQSYIPIVDHFKYLGRFIISRGVTDDRDIDARILKAGNTSGLIQKLSILVFILVYLIFLISPLKFFSALTPVAAKVNIPLDQVLFLKQEVGLECELLRPTVNHRNKEIVDTTGNINQQLLQIKFT